MNSIILIGMPGCGKSTIGVLLAKTLGKQFLDTDLRIQEEEKALLQEIIDRKGNAYFRQTEERVLCSIDADDAVIATGGSAVYSSRAMTHLKRLGRIVYLSLPLAEIERRVQNIRTRGISMAPGETLAELFRERVPLYRQYADLTISLEGLDFETELEKILLSLSNQTTVPVLQ